ncbi:spore-associated protein A [Streptomyces sp. NPDC093225]|uniref:spore-associated protein A n=1 Tax=Streptomyces sp. NPDC093225 TaxID=3366034 RepID=UPI0037FE9554
MRRARRGAVITAALTTLASAALLASAGPASAADGYNGACGSGYAFVDAIDLYLPYDHSFVGTTYLTYNRSNGYNCAVVQLEPSPTVRWSRVVLSRGDGSGRDRDMGYYRSYAGPVYTYARRTCIDWSAFVGETDNDLGAARVDLDDVRCG